VGFVPGGDIAKAAVKGATKAVKGAAKAGAKAADNVGKVVKGSTAAAADGLSGAQKGAGKVNAPRGPPNAALPEVTVSKARFPETAKHIEGAQAAGAPSTLTIGRPGAGTRRRESLKGTKRKKGLDRDEYPPAMFEEGGNGASVRPISPSDNRGAGACIGAQCRALPDGARVRVKVTK